VLLDPTDQFVAARMAPTRICEMPACQDRVAGGSDQLVAAKDEVDGDLMLVRRDVMVGDLCI
jgi:hypothetical protein